jgi:hypothetical protein
VRLLVAVEVRKVIALDVLLMTLHGRVRETPRSHHRLDAPSTLTAEHAHQVAHVDQEGLRVAVATAREEVGAGLRVATRRCGDAGRELDRAHARLEPHRVPASRRVPLEHRRLALVECAQLRRARAAFGRARVDLPLRVADVREGHLLATRSVQEVLETRQRVGGVTRLTARRREHLLGRDRLPPCMETRGLSLRLCGVGAEGAHAGLHQTRSTGEALRNDLIDLDLTGLRGRKREAHRGLERIALETGRGEASARRKVLSGIGTFRVGLAHEPEGTIERLGPGLARARLQRRPAGLPHGQRVGHVGVGHPGIMGKLLHARAGRDHVVATPTGVADRVVEYATGDRATLTGVLDLPVHVARELPHRTPTRDHDVANLTEALSPFALGPHLRAHALPGLLLGELRAAPLLALVRPRGLAVEPCLLGRLTARELLAELRLARDAPCLLPLGLDVGGELGLGRALPLPCGRLFGPLTFAERTQPCLLLGAELAAGLGDLLRLQAPTVGRPVARGAPEGRGGALTLGPQFGERPSRAAGVAQNRQDCGRHRRLPRAREERLHDRPQGVG